MCRDIEGLVIYMFMYMHDSLIKSTVTSESLCFEHGLFGIHELYKRQFNCAIIPSKRALLKKGHGLEQNEIASLVDPS